MRANVGAIDLFTYQEIGAEFLARKERAGMLDLPGVGKTCQTIRAIDLRRLTRGVVICPAHLRENWVSEFRKFSVFERKICKGKTIHDFVAWSRAVFDIIIISYELAVKWEHRFHEHGDVLDFLVIDEFHMLNNINTARTKAVLGADGNGEGGIAMWAAQAWPLTGTLMRNDPSNSYVFLTFMRAIDMPFATFVRRYFHSRSSTWGQRNKVKPAMAAELQGLIAEHSIRRTLQQVGHELPPIFLTTAVVDGDTSGIVALLRDHPGLDEAIVAAVAKGGLSFLDAQHIATMRRLIAEAKALPYVEMLIGELSDDPERKVIVGGVSRDALRLIHDTLNARGFRSVVFQGGVSEKQKIDNEREFQSDPSCRVAVINYTSGGTGLTLTAANWADIFESSWVPADNDQFIKRIRRISQKRTQHARFVGLARSLDEVVVRTVAQKTAAIAEIDGEPMLAAPPEEAA